MAEEYANETTDDFLSRLGSTVTQGYVCLSMAFGLQSGLFKTLVDHHETPMTSQEIADAAGMKERYVREWLGGMVTAHIVNIDPDTEKYHLPSHRVPGFQEGVMSGTTSAWCKGIPMMNEAYEEMLKCIKKDGPLGVPYSKYTQFQKFEADCNILWVQNHLCRSLIPSLPVLQQSLEKGIRVLDLGCGRGGASRCLAENFPNSKITGLDISEDALEFAKETAKSKNLTNLDYVCIDATEMPADWTDTFDYVYIFDVIHDLPRPDKVLKELKRVVKSGGMMSVFEPDMQEKLADNIELSNASLYYIFSLFHCLPISYQYPGSMGLGACWGREPKIKFFESHGFTVESIMAQPDMAESHFWCKLSSK